MNRLFGSSPSKPPKSTLNDAIASTDSRAASLEVKIAKLDADLGRYKSQMAKLRTGPAKNSIQQRALATLRQKKMIEAQLATLMQQSFNMESAAMTTENLRNTMITVDAMKTASKELRKQYGEIDIDKIEDLHDTMAELLEEANQVQESLGRSYEVPTDLDEADLNAELEALGTEIEEDGESASYLEDAVPDFIDEAPVEARKEAAVTGT